MLDFATTKEERDVMSLALELVCTAAETGLTEEDGPNDSAISIAIQRCNRARAVWLCRGWEGCAGEPQNWKDLEEMLGHKIEFIDRHFKAE